MRVSDGLGAVVRYEYDSLNRRTRETRLLSEGLTQRVDYHYDPAGRLIEVEQSADQEGCGSQFASTRYEYDGMETSPVSNSPPGARSCGSTTRPTA